MMKTKASHNNRLLRIITVPVRALCKARDFYVKSMTNYADRMNYGSHMGLPGASQGVGMPRSFSVNSSRSSYNDEDFRELVRTASARVELDSYVKNRMTAGSESVGRGPRGMPPRSSSVAMGRIDEDRPCCYFGDNYNISSSMVSARNEIKYPRSKSHAFTTARTSNGF